MPTQLIGEAAVPGGQEVEVPPQHAHRKPSIAQYFQQTAARGAVRQRARGLFDELIERAHHVPRVCQGVSIIHGVWPSLLST